MNGILRRRALTPAIVVPSTTIPAGATSPVLVDAFNFILTFGTVWNLYHSGSLIADDTSTGGWNVVYVSGSTYDVTVPGGASSSTGLDYHFVFSPSHTGHITDVGHFDVA